MRRFFPAIVFVLAAFWIGASFVPAKKSHNDLDLAGFGKIPVLVGGRVKPLDTVARNSLLIIRTKEILRLDDGQQISAIRWLADTLFNAPVADQYPAFVIQNADVLGLFGWQQSDRKYFSFAQLTPFLKQIDEQGEQAEKLQTVERSAYQSAILNLRNALVLYQRLKNSVQPEGAEDFAAELQAFEQAVPEAARAARARETGASFDPAQLDRIAEVMQGYERLADMAYLLAVPQPSGPGDWRSVGQAIMQSIVARGIDPVVKLYASLGDGYRAGNRAAFEGTVDRLIDRIAQLQPTGVKRARYEFFFNAVDPFTHSMTLYVLAFLLACISWLAWQRPLNRAAFYLLLLAIAVHTFGLVSRMYLQERPPVTNLYSSAIFIGWGAVIVALILERIFRDGIGAACAGAIGFITLIIAHHLGGNGDTLEMLQAVLDTNIWLATHVVAITTGYSAMFLAGMLAIIYIVRGVLGRSIVGTFLGLGPEGKRRGIDRALVRNNFACALGRFRSPAWSHDHGDLRQCGDEFFMVRCQHARRWPALLRIHAEGFSLARWFHHQPARAHVRSVNASGAVAKFSRDTRDAFDKPVDFVPPELAVRTTAE
ncbi:MAG: cytochrome C biogenesis protein [Verrucomicrobia bacterium]|nr:MAG: cytochrome C biogenesis protein [Verrucomicrobiota bacterium]